MPSANPSRDQLNQSMTGWKPGSRRECGPVCAHHSQRDNPNCFEMPCPPKDNQPAGWKRALLRQPSALRPGPAGSRPPSNWLRKSSGGSGPGNKIIPPLLLCGLAARRKKRTRSKESAQCARRRENSPQYADKDAGTYIRVRGMFREAYQVTTAAIACWSAAC